MDPVLSFEAVGKHYGDTRALVDVSFSVAEGEVFGLLGPNGAGKTTLIRILMDILRADSGRVVLFGEPLRREHLDRTGYLPEERGLYLKQGVLEVLTYFGRLKGLTIVEARRRSRQWLERLGLAETERWRIERLSKGMSQKVQIAATLLHDPELAVLDEPYTGLDPVNVQLVQDLIRERRTRGLTTILSTHQMAQVEELCDSLALIDGGELLVSGPVDAIRERFSRREIWIRASSALPAVSGVARIGRDDVGGYCVALDDGASPAAVLARWVEVGIEIDHFERRVESMHEIFIRVVDGGER